MNFGYDSYSPFFYKRFKYHPCKIAFRPNSYSFHSSGLEFRLFNSTGLNKKAKFNEVYLNSEYLFSFSDNLSALICAVGMFSTYTKHIRTNNDKFNYTYELQLGLNNKSDDFVPEFLYPHDFKNGRGGRDYIKKERYY